MYGAKEIPVHAGQLLLAWMAGWRRGLQALEVGGGALSMSGGREDGVVVFGKNFEPVAEIGVPSENGKHTRYGRYDQKPFVIRRK